MPIKKRQDKRETRVAKVDHSHQRMSGRLKATESSSRGREKHIADTSLVSIPCDDQSRREKLPKISEDLSEGSLGEKQVTVYVPVVSATGTSLMPCHPARARELVRKGRALRRFRSGIFYIQLVDRKSGYLQEVSIGIDTGSKREAFTVKRAERTFLNVLSDAVTWVKGSLEARRNMRRARRNRKTPCRKNKYNRSRHPFPPSTKARWQVKLRIINILRQLYPIKIYVIEDIKAKTKKDKKIWNKSFSPLEVGKNWFYNEVRKLGLLVLKSGHETYMMRTDLSLEKTKDKLAEIFEAHNVDSWVLANSVFNKQKYPDNKRILRMIPLQFHRRQLHALQSAKHGQRRKYGGTISIGLKRGSLVKTDKYGICYVGGNSKNRISVHDIKTGERLARNVKVDDTKMICYNYWKVHYLPSLKAGVPMHN